MPAKSQANPMEAKPPHSAAGNGISSRELDSLSSLVSPPHICVRITELLANPRAEAREIGSVIAQDPSLTARLLRVVNSPFYGFRSRIDSVTRAVALVGHGAVHNLAVAVSAVKSFSEIPNDLVNMDTFWRHGVYCGLIARACATHAPIPQPERLFVAGLLHDLGSLVLYQSRPEACRETLLIADGDEAVLYQAEIEAFGFSHADLGGRLMVRWGLPAALADAVAYHHAPAAAEVAPFEAAILHIAEALANRSRIGAFSEQSRGEATVDDIAWLVLGATDPEALSESLIAQADERFLDTVQLLTPPRSAPPATRTGTARS